MPDPGSCSAALCPPRGGSSSWLAQTPIGTHTTAEASPASDNTTSNRNPGDTMRHSPHVAKNDATTTAEATIHRMILISKTPHPAPTVSIRPPPHYLPAPQAFPHRNRNQPYSSRGRPQSLYALYSDPESPDRPGNQSFQEIKLSVKCFVLPSIGEVSLVIRSSPGTVDLKVFPARSRWT